MLKKSMKSVSKLGIRSVAVLVIFLTISSTASIGGLLVVHGSSSPASEGALQRGGVNYAALQQSNDSNVCSVIFVYNLSSNLAS